MITLVTYAYFVFALIGRQKIHGFGPGNDVLHEFMRSGRIPLEMDLYFPLFTILQLFFYMGLLKVRTNLQNKTWWWILKGNGLRQNLKKS